MERLRQLEAAGEAEAGALMRDEAVERAPVEDDAAGVVAQGAAKTVDKRALARPVRPDQADAIARGDRQVDAFERDKAAEPLAETADLEQCRRGHDSLARRCARTSPTMPLGAMMTKPIKSNPTINRLSAEEI